MKLQHLKYITFSELMSSVSSDMERFADGGMIDNSKYIKVVRKINSDLGLTINQEKEVLLDVKNHKIQLPSDFEYLQLALLCEETPQECIISKTADNAPKLVQCLTGQSVNNNCSMCPTSCPEGSKTSLCGNCYKVYHYQNYDKTFIYNTKTPIKLTKKSYKYCAPNCLNTMLTSEKYKYTLDVNDRVMILSGVKEGKVYVNYITDMVNEEGELILVDHPLILDYYEYAIKDKMLENYLMNNDADVSEKLKYVKQQLTTARAEALSFANMEEFTEFTAYQKAKRENFYNRYFKQFERY